MIPSIRKPIVLPLPKLPDISKHVEAVQRLQERLDPGKAVATRVGEVAEVLRRADDFTTCPPIRNESAWRGLVRKAVDWVRGFSVDVRSAAESPTLDAPRIEAGSDGFRFDTGEAGIFSGHAIVHEMRVRRDGDDVLRFRQEITQTFGQPGFGVHANRDSDTGVVTAGVELRAPMMVTWNGATIATANVGVSATFDPAAVGRAIDALP